MNDTLPKEIETAIVAYRDAWRWMRGSDPVNRRAELEAAILDYARKEVEEAALHLRQDMPAPEGVCVCGHGAADHCEPGCCGASCRFPVDDEDLDKPPCRCRHFKRALSPSSPPATNDKETRHAD